MDGDLERLVLQMRKRVMRVYDLRGEHGQNIGLEIVLQELLFGALQLVRREVGDVALAKLLFEHRKRAVLRSQSGCTAR
jgi:hypothetical protein